MENLWILLSVWGLFMVTVMTPGPDFLVVAQTALRQGARAGMMCAVGIATGLLFHTTYCLLGVAFLIKESPTLFLIFKVLGALYLIYLGIMAWRNTKKTASTDTPEPNEKTISLRSHFMVGFLTNVLNVKAMFWILVFYTSILPETFSLLWRILFLVSIVLGAVVFFIFLALVVTRPFVLSRLQRAGPWIDRAVGLVLILFAIEIFRELLEKYLA